MYICNLFGTCSVLQIKKGETMENIQLTDEERALFKYIPNEERLKSYVVRMGKCASMDEVEDCVLIPMLLHEPNITAESSEKKDFYTRLQPFINHLRGAGNTAMYERIGKLNRILKKENKNKLSFGGMLQQIEVAVPKPGEEAHCIVELIITPSEGKDRMIAITATLAGVEYRKTTNKHFDGECGVNISPTSYVIKGDTRRLSVLLSYMDEYWDSEEIYVHYKSGRIDREGLTLSQAKAFADHNV